jgi:glutathione S-transferase
MITLWHCVDARSFRALWALEEIGLPYRLEMLPFPPRFLAREYLAINPLGTIPLMIDGDVRMTESAAICQYLADRYAGPPLAVGRDEPAYASYLNALHFGEATLTFPQTIVLRYSRLEPEARRLPQAAADYARWTLGRLRGLETMMAGAEYASAGRFTMADISIGYALMLPQFTGLDDQTPEPLRGYFARLSARPAFGRAKAAQALAAREQNIPIPPFLAQKISPAGASATEAAT